ncbi:MAG: hypothetical protein WA971_10630, partial [Microbacterium sp.]
VYEAVSVGTPVLLRDAGIARDLPEGMRLLAADDGVAAFSALIRAFVAAPPVRTTPTDAFAQSRLTGRMLELYALAQDAHAVRVRGVPTQDGRRVA